MEFGFADVIDGVKIDEDELDPVTAMPLCCETDLEDLDILSDAVELTTEPGLEELAIILDVALEELAEFAACDEADEVEAPRLLLIELPCTDVSAGELPGDEPPEDPDTGFAEDADEEPVPLEVPDDVTNVTDDVVKDPIPLVLRLLCIEVLEYIELLVVDVLIGDAVNPAVGLLLVVTGDCILLLLRVLLSADEADSELEPTISDEDPDILTLPELRLFDELTPSPGCDEVKSVDEPRVIPLEIVCIDVGAEMLPRVEVGEPFDTEFADVEVELAAEVERELAPLTDPG